MCDGTGHACDSTISRCSLALNRRSCSFKRKMHINIKRDNHNSHMKFECNKFMRQVF